MYIRVCIRVIKNTQCSRMTYVKRAHCGILVAGENKREASVFFFRKIPRFYLKSQDVPVLLHERGDEISSSVIAFPRARAKRILPEERIDELVTRFLPYPIHPPITPGRREKKNKKPVRVQSIQCRDSDPRPSRFHATSRTIDCSRRSNGDR